jgi:histidinol-phosphate/aromatic aminotransferase/cobyric acid decarboxylase-like protein
VLSRTTGVAERDQDIQDMPSFAEVMEALERYTDETGARPLMLGGWEVEHPAITPPPALLSRLGKRSTRLRRYAYSRDLRHAREQAADLLGSGLSFDSASLTTEHVSIQQNSTQALLLALAALKERGVRHVVIAAPAYYAVETICRNLGLETLLVPAADFLTGALDIARLSQAAHARGSVVLVTNPAYSLGVEYRPEDITLLARALPPDAWLLLDETRLGLSWRYDAPWYRSDLSPRAIVVRSPSKVFFINGLKASLLLGDPILLRHVERLGEALVGSLSGDAESVALAYLAAWRAWRDEAASGQNGPMTRWRRAVLDGLRRNLTAARDALIPAGFSFSPIDSGPYALAAAPRGQLPQLDSLTAAREHGVLLMESRYFLHEHADWQGFRINLCCADRHQTEALSRLQALW